MAIPGRAITPEEAVELKSDVIPPEVFMAFNETIARHLNGGQASFRQAEVVSLIAGRVDCSAQYIFEHNWLDVEAVYRKAGWLVTYDKPGYNESGDATFIFTIKR